VREISNRERKSSARRIAARIRGPPVLVVLCGPSHVGKSTFSKRLRKDFVIVSSDEVRRQLGVAFNSSGCEAKVWHAYEAAKRKALIEGRNVILDACHMSPQARWHALQGPNGHHRKICVVFDLPRRTVRERCIGANRMPVKEAERMWRVFQDSKPTAEELKRLGFDDVYFVRDRARSPSARCRR